MSPIHPSQRAGNIEAFQVMEVLGRAKELEADGSDVVHFEVGEPDFATAAPIVSAGQRALGDGLTGYTQALGIPELRAAIARDYAERFDVAVDPRRVAVTAGASAALNLIFAALLEDGAGVLITDPGYPCNETFITLLGGVPKRVPVGANSNFQMSARLAREAWDDDTVGILLASPSNPTGAMLETSELQGITALAQERGGFVIVDEIYQGLVYEDAPPTQVTTTSLAVEQSLIVVNSFSKYFGMTGWRLGWMVVPESIVGVVERLAQNLYISPPTIAQYAALAAFTDASFSIFEERRVRFGARRDLMLEGLKEAGLPVAIEPHGAFYLYVDVRSTGLRSDEFCWRLIEEHHVATTPGSDFGAHRADDFVRFAYTTGEERIEQGMQRVVQAVEKYRREI